MPVTAARKVVATLPALAAFLCPPDGKAKRLHFRNCDGVLTFSPARDAKKGHWVALDGRLLGQVLPTGEVVERDAMPPSALCLLDDLEVNPVGTAAEHGRSSGVCCFCNRELTDARSKEAGYGPTCAASHKLPWGK